MSENPYRAPQEAGRRKLWPTIWRYVGWAGAGMTCLCLVADRIMATRRTEPPTPAFLMVDGLVALGLLSGVVITGIAIIGWIVTRDRAAVTMEQGEP